MSNTERIDIPLAACPLCGGPMSWCGNVPNEDLDTHHCDQLVCQACKYHVDFNDEVTHDCADMKTLQQHVAGKWSRRAGYAARQPYPSREVLADLLAALNYRQYATNAEEDRLRKKIERALRDFNIATAKFVAPPAPDAATAQEN